jgi:hypothetical protein
MLLIGRTWVQVMFEIYVVGVRCIYDWFCWKIIPLQFKMKYNSWIGTFSNFNFGPHYLSS